MFKVPENYRVNHLSTKDIGNNGAFIVPFSLRTKAYIIVSDGEDWEHVSVHVTSDGKERTPTWAEMCRIKNLFWSEEDCVIQFHPPKSEYVNNHKHTLHLWRPINQTIPQPPTILVGLK